MAFPNTAAETDEILVAIKDGHYTKAMQMIHGPSDTALLLALLAIARELDRANGIGEGR